MYLDMLEQAVSAFRAGRTPSLERPLAAVSEVELHVPALLPEDYVPDVHLRLALYQRIAAAGALELADMSRRADRPLRRRCPRRPTHLLQLAGLRLQARELGIRRLDLGPTGRQRDVRGAEHDRCQPPSSGSSSARRTTTAWTGRSSCASPGP